MQFLGLIPARYASTRFPGKPLADIAGKSMIRRVYEQASLCFENVYVATDDDRIKRHVLEFGGKVVMTSEDHRSGTDRCAEAAKIISDLEGTGFEVVINIQGDEPFIQTEQLELICSCFNEKDTEIASLVKKISNAADLVNLNIPKVILNNKQEAIYFSRSTIPYIRNVPMEQWLERHTFFKHIGLYAYRYETLMKLTILPPSSLELAESLEQIRWLQNGFKIKIAETKTENLAIDTPQDLERIKEYLGKITGMNPRASPGP
jgi:3-deoxy-manno-octulosonate cytidylyltransferase (CMP-KDO synthetase)